MRVKMDEFQNSLVLRGWLRDPFNFLGRVFLNKWPCCCSCRKVKIYTLIHYPSPSCHLPPPPHIWYFTLSVFPFYVLCKFSFGLRVTARKTIKQRRGKFKPGAASSSPAMSGVCCSYKWTEHNVNVRTRKKPTKSSRLQLTAYQEINIFIPKKHGTATF